MKQRNLNTVFGQYLKNNIPDINVKPGQLCVYRVAIMYDLENVSSPCMNDVTYYQQRKTSIDELTGQVNFNPEVFKLWVATQTWVERALSLGHGPFCDPPKNQNK